MKIKNEEISLEWKKILYISPHVHEIIEVVYITDGSIELGIGQQLYDMDKGDFAIIFPNIIHYAKSMTGKENKVVYIHLEPAMFPFYYTEVQKYKPKDPVIKKEKVYPDIVYAVKSLVNKKESTAMLMQAYTQMILARVFSEMELIDQSIKDSERLVYSAVEYVADNFRNEISLEKMAYELCVSKYVLSRMFAKTFHRNFNKYVNDIRLDYAASVIENSMESITNICLDSGFESQRTFNRVFKERYQMTPREYRYKMNGLKANDIEKTLTQPHAKRIIDKDK